LSNKEDGLLLHPAVRFLFIATTLLLAQAQYPVIVSDKCSNISFLECCCVRVTGM